MAALLPHSALVKALLMHGKTCRLSQLNRTCMCWQSTGICTRLQVFVQEQRFVQCVQSSHCSEVVSKCACCNAEAVVGDPHRRGSPSSSCTRSQQTCLHLMPSLSTTMPSAQSPTLTLSKACTTRPARITTERYMPPPAAPMSADSCE